MTFLLSFGRFGGFYADRGEVTWRLCLGWVAFTVIFEDDSFIPMLEAEIADLEAKVEKYEVGGTNG